MKTQEEIKNIMETIKNELPEATRDNTISLQGQYMALKWVLDEKEEKKDE